MLAHMRAIRKYDDDLASESSEMTVQEHQWVPWRKPLVVGTCAALVVAAMVVFKRMPVGLGEVAQNEVIELSADDGCSSDTENCMETKCCKIKGRKCFMKNEYWSNCNDDCDPNYVDDWDKSHGITDGWNCKELKKGECAKDHEDCTGKDGCCSEGHICYIKNDHWKNCNKGCKLGVGANEFESKDYKHESWSCEIHELGQYCPDLNESSGPADELQCCKTTFCKSKTDDECADICAFYINATAATNTTGAANTTAATNETGASTTDAPSSTTDASPNTTAAPAPQPA